jgi:hypothetical protein
MAARFIFVEVDTAGDLTSIMETALGLAGSAKPKAAPPVAAASKPGKAPALAVTADDDDEDDEAPTPLVVSRRVKLARWLMEHGPREKGVVQATLGISSKGQGCWSHVVNCDWFHVNADGVVSVTSKGEAEQRRAV